MIALALAVAMTGAWTPWAPRPEIAPKTIERSGTFEIAGGGNAGAHGGWERRVDGIEAGNWYRLDALYRADGVAYEHLQITARLDWVDAAGKRTGQPDYAWQVQPEGDWKRVLPSWCRLRRARSGQDPALPFQCTERPSRLEGRQAGSGGRSGTASSESRQASTCTRTTPGRGRQVSQPSRPPSSRS